MPAESLLYHYTCGHAVPLIRAAGHLIRTTEQPWFRPESLRRIPAGGRWLPGVLWFTDLDVPHRYGLGLTMDTLRCDRSG